MHILPKKLVLYVSFLAVAISFTLVCECNAQRVFRRPIRQQQIENRVRQISPQSDPSDQKPTPAAAEQKAEESPAPAVVETPEKAPAPAVKEESKEKPAPAVKEKAKKAPAPAVKEESKEKPAPTVKEKTEESPAPAVKEKAEEKPESSILEKETPNPEKATPDSKEVSSDSLHEEAIKHVLDNPDVPEEAKTALKQASKEDIQKSVEEATAEVEADNLNEHIDGVVETSRMEVDEDSIEKSVNEVLESSEETLNEELKKSESVKTDGEIDDSIPDSIDQIVDSIDSDMEEEADESAEVVAENAEDADDDDDDDDDDAEAETKEAEAPQNAKMVKLADLDQELKVPENATFEELHAFLVGLDSISPEDLDRSNQEIMMTQAKTFLEKVFQAKLAASNQMLALDDLTDEQWREGVSWKVQSLANLFQIDAAKIADMREFVEEIRPNAPKDILWTMESILIQMELAQLTEEPTPEELKEYVNRMLEHTKKGIEEKCVSQDFVLATVQMVALTEDALPKEESRAIFESAIETLNTSDEPKLKEMAKFLQKILDQREITGKTPDLTLETYDGKTIKTADFVGKTLLIYCFQMSSRDQLQDLGLVYQIYLAFHSRGLEVIGIVPEEKTDAMDDLLKQIPWPMVFEGNNTENPAIEKLCVPTFPTKVLVNAEGKIENGNIQPMDLLKYLETTYGPVSKASDDETPGEADDAEEEDDADNTEAIESPADEEDNEAPEIDVDEDEAPVEKAKKVKEKVKEKAEETAEDLLDELNLDL